MSQAMLSNVERLARQLSHEERAILIDRLASVASPPAPMVGRDLYGLYRGRLPADVDLDAVLSEIRSAWTRSDVEE